MLGLAGIKGQDRARELLTRSLAAGKLPHAYLFAGPAGVGKRTTALALAAALNCEGPQVGAASCACGPCSKLEHGLHPDFLRLAPGGPGGFIVIEQVRDLMAVLAYPPHEGRARLVLVEDAERMNPAAQNALLKTLEEPPNRTHLVLTSTSPDRLLVTIPSRCQRVRFAPLPVELVATLLSANGVTGDAARAAARLAGGSVARAMELAAGEALGERWQRARAIVQAARAGAGGSVSMRATIAAAAELAEDKEAVVPTLELLAHFYRDAAACAARGSVRGGGGEWDDEVAVEAARAPAGIAAKRAAAVLDTQTAILGFASAPLALEQLILTLSEGGER